MPAIGINSTLIKKYGLPTAFAAAAFGALLWLMKVQVDDGRAQRTEIAAKVDVLDDKIEKLRNDVDFLNRNVDLTCGRK